MKKRIIVNAAVIVKLFLIYFIMVSIQSCKQDFVTTEPTVDFPADVKTVFNTTYNATNNTCTSAGCHSSENRAAGLDLVNWQNTMAGSNNGTMVIPYNGFWSHLTSTINSDTNLAPVSQVFTEVHKIDSSKVHTVINWINSGAPNQNGEVANQTFTNKAFITNQATDLIAVVNTDNQTVTRMFSVGGRSNILDAPHYITTDPQKHFIYVSLIQEGYIEKYDINTFQLTGRMSAGLNPAHIVISPDGNTGFVTNFDAGGTEKYTKKFSTTSMTILDTATDLKMKAPHGMAISNDGNFIYVTSQISEWIFKINTSDMSIVLDNSIDVSVPPSGNGTGNFKPYQVILSPDNSKLYVTCVSSNQVRVYNSSDLSFIQSISVGPNPLLLKFSRDGQLIFVCNRNPVNPSDPASGSVSVINASTNSVSTTFSEIGVQPHGVDFTADGQYGIIACETQSGQDGHHPTVGSYKIGITRFIRMSDLSLLPRKVEMGSFPAGVTTNP
ncbi:hypothetical protein BH10BAC5_BH10BAC5_00740 [soil metagenome]